MFDGKWLFGIIIATFVSSIVAILLDRFVLNKVKQPTDIDGVCGKFYRQFGDFLMANYDSGEFIKSETPPEEVVQS